MDNIPSVMAGMVLYNSDYDRLRDCLNALEGQVKTTVIFDNSPKEMDVEKQNYLKCNYNCKYVFSKKNLGMPEAMNRIMEIGEKEGCEWVLTMNADSIVPANLVNQYAPFFGKKNIGMICPQVVDRRRKYMSVDSEKKNKFVKMCITSGACTRVQAWKQVGKFDGWLFVDLLDNDISKRMILNKWKILQVNSVVLDQEFGDIRAKAKWKENFWLRIGKILNNDNFAKFSYKKIVHSNRVYYTCRNIIYLNAKFKEYGGIGYKENYNCSTFLGFIICFVIPSILRADKKIEVIKAAYNGFSDGKKKAKRTTPWKAQTIK